MFLQAIKEKIDFQTNTFQSPQKNIMHIAYGADAKFMIGVGICITSIILNNPDLSFHFHIITDELTSKDRQRIHTLTSAHDNIQITLYITNKDYFENLPNNELWPQAIYYRLIIASVLYNKTKKALYLDADTLCLSSLKELASISFDGKSVLVAIQLPEESNHHLAYLHENFNFTTNEYFNSGFLYIDIDKWQEEKIAEKTLSLLAKTKELIFFDQDALNIIINDDKTRIDEKFNYCYWATYKHEPPDNTVIIHYLGPHKPWMAWYCNERIRKVYLDYKNKSPWQDEPLTQPKTKRQIRLMAKRFALEKKFLQSLNWLLLYFKKMIVNS